MIAYAVFDNDEIRFVPFELDELRKNGVIELEGRKYTPTEIGSNFHIADLKGQKVQVFIVKKK